MLSPLSLVLLLSSAHAGGLGLIATGGAHQDKVYGYIDNGLDDYTQDPQTQFLTNMGGGLEIMLGDKDEKMIGMFRGYYIADAPQKDLEVPSGTSAEDFSYNIRSERRDIGVITAGLQWNVIGDPSQAQLVVVTNIGSGFLTRDSSEFLLGEAGVGGTYNLSRNIQLNANVTGGIRFRKSLTPTTNAVVGARYFFD